MTVSTGADSQVTCTQCGHLNRPTDRFCESCGTGVGRPGTRRNDPPPWLGSQQRDAVTRYLCAAAHLDPTFARRAIAEYLVEPVRALPPSPGLHVVAVLRDCVAAQRRRLIRDVALLVLFVVALFTTTALTVLWTVIAIVVAAVAGNGTDRRRGPWAAMIVLVLALLVVLFVATSGVPYLLLRSGIVTSTSGPLITAAVLTVLVFGVLLTDEIIVDELTRNRFRPALFQAETPTTPGWERRVRTLGMVVADRALARVTASISRRPEHAGTAEVVVHRGWVPFVGSGKLIDDRTISLPLVPAEDGDEPRPFGAVELHAHVRAAMRELRASTSLSPDRRLAGMEIVEQVYLPAERLGHLPGSPMADVLPEPHRPPAHHIDVERARSLADDPIESGRYYLCFRIEAWDRQLAVSCFFTAATDQRTLYLEWSTTVLNPLLPAYRSIDRPQEMAPGLQAAQSALTLPATLPSRLAAMFSRDRPIPARPGELVPERYGAGPSLREMAAASASDNFFQDADALRYVTLVEQGLFRAVEDFLGTRGYSVKEVMSQARRVISNSITINGGTFTDSAVGNGRVQRTTVDSSSSEPTRRTP